MEAKTDRLYPSAPLENNDLEQRVERKLNDVNSFIDHINKIKELITYFKNKNNKPKKEFKKYKTLTTKLKSFDTIVFTATTSSSVTLSHTGIDLIVVPISTATARALSFGNKLVYEIVMQKYNKYKEQDEKRSTNC